MEWHGWTCIRVDTHTRTPHTHLGEPYWTGMVKMWKDEDSIVGDTNRNCMADDATVTCPVTGSAR